MSDRHKVGPSYLEWVCRRDDHLALKRRGIGYIGINEIAEVYELSRVKPYDALVKVVVKGSLWIWQASGWRVMNAGDAALCPHGKPHHFRIGPTKQATLSWILFDPGRIGTPSDIAVQAIDHLPFYHCTQGLVLTLGNRSSHAGDLVELWAELAVRLATEIDQVQGTSLRDLWRTVRSDPARPWDIPTMALQAGMSETSLRRACRKQCGSSPSAELLRIRMERASLLLTTTTLPLAMIAPKVGYHDPFAFAVAFRRWAGTSPGAYRKRTDFAP